MIGSKFALFALASLIASFSCAVALDRTWSPQSGDFSVVLPSGWAQDGTPPGNPDAMIVVSTRPVDPMRTCGVSGRSQAVPDSATQAQANAAISGMNANSMMDGFPNNGRVISFENAERSGVQMASIVFEYEQPPNHERIRSYGKVFAIVRGGEFRYYSVNCGAALPATEDEFAVLEAFMGSISFSAPVATPEIAQ